MSDMEPNPAPIPGPDDIASPDPMESALLAALGRAGQDLAATEVPSATADAHLAAIFATASEHAHVVPAATATAGSSWAARARRVAGLTAVKIGLAAGVAAAGTMGLAASDNLPEPVQRVVSDGASLFGVELPHPDAPVLPDEADEEAHDQADLPTPPAPADVAPDPVPPADPPHQDRVPTWAPTAPPFVPDNQSDTPANRDDAATDGTDRAPVDPPADEAERPPVDPPADEADRADNTDNTDDRGAQHSGDASGRTPPGTNPWASTS